jgi:hypothetical protein
VGFRIERLHPAARSAGALSGNWTASGLAAILAPKSGFPSLREPIQEFDASRSCYSQIFRVHWFLLIRTPESKVCNAPVPLFSSYFA